MKGKFTGRAEAWELTENDAGDVQIIVQFRLEGNQNEHDGAIRTWRGYFKSDKSQEIALKALMTMGWNTGDVMDLQGLGANLVELVIDEEEWEGKVHDKIKWVNRVGSGSTSLNVTPLAKDKKAAFAEKMKGKIALLSQKEAQANGAPSKSSAPEDIPF